MSIARTSGRRILGKKQDSRTYAASDSPPEVMQASVIFIAIRLRPAQHFQPPTNPQYQHYRQN